MYLRYRVALQGFDGPERSSLLRCLHTDGDAAPAYEQVAGLPESDFVVADADQPGVIDRVIAAGRLRDTVFIGQRAPDGAYSHLRRPFEPAGVTHELGELVALRQAAAPELTVEVMPPPEPLPPRAPRRREDDPPPTQPGALSDPRVRAKAAARAAARRARQAATKGDAPAAGPAEVLVLDDSEVARRFLGHLLGLFGFKPRMAGRFAEAVALLAERPYSAVFLDVVLGGAEGEDGLELCQRIKQGEIALGGPTPAVVIVSGQAAAADRVRAKLAGCDAFLTKPISRGDVARTLETCRIGFPADARQHG